MCFYIAKRCSWDARWTKYRNINERWPEVWITNSCSYSINKLTWNSASLNLLHCFLTNIGKQAEEIIIEEILSSDIFQCMRIFIYHKSNHGLKIPIVQDKCARITRVTFLDDYDGIRLITTSWIYIWQKDYTIRNFSSSHKTQNRNKVFELWSRLTP